MDSQVIDARQHDLGDGFLVNRVLPHRTRRMVGPFIFLDHMGPLDMAGPIPGSRDVRPHPHIGLSTVTYLFDGQMTHRDSLGVEQVITPGALNWMTAGSGITHSERFDGMRETGGHIEGIQAWVALPATHEDGDCAFDHYDAGKLPSFDDEGVSGRVIAGDAWGMNSPAVTLSPLFYVHVELQPGARLDMPGGHAERAVFVAGGVIELSGRRYRANQLIVLAKGSRPDIKAVTRSRLMLLGGESLGPRYIWWNLVSSRREQILQCAADWKAGRMALPPNDAGESIPLPDTPFPPEHKPGSGTQTGEA